MEFNTSNLTPDQSKAKDIIKSILQFISLNVAKINYNNTPSTDYLYYVNVSNNKKTITIKKRGYKKQYIDYKGKHHFELYPLESITVYLNKDLVDIVYRTDTDIHYANGSPNEYIEYLGLDIYQYLIGDLVDRRVDIK